VGHPVIKVKYISAVVSVAAALLALSACAAEPQPFLFGGDISALPKLESLGAVYRDGGQTGDALAIMRRHGSTPAFGCGSS
jgi:arabinogalactan endo-1,4-beta-galactosidase